MKKALCLATLLTVVLLLVGSPVLAGFAYEANKPHLGGDVTPAEAFEMVKKDPQHIFLVDCRTRAEYQFVGHPEGAYNIPINFLSTDAGKKGYIEKANPNFGKDLQARFNPATDTLIIFCRSGNRSCVGCNEAIKAGWSEDKVFNMMGGFEGGKNTTKGSSFYGQRWDGGWQREGLPWTYSMDTNLMYKPDVDKMAAGGTDGRLKVARK
jgi:rhodanese-related sulfurtransferase